MGPLYTTNERMGAPEYRCGPRPEACLAGSRYSRDRTQGLRPTGMMRRGVISVAQKQETQLKSVSVTKLSACIAIAAMAWIVPAPAGLTDTGWHLLGVFVATIASFLIRPLAMGPMVLLAIVGLSVTNTLKFKGLMAGFGNGTVWLVVAAFLIAGAVARTGFGSRIALTLVKQLGKNHVGLGLCHLRR